jgi:uncharacterized protein YodC (DUF2158 family)
MSESIKAGSIVRLKSGGPAMTVVGVVPSKGDSVELVHCTWFAGAKSESGAFPTDAVEPVEPGDKSIRNARVIRA